MNAKQWGGPACLANSSANSVPVAASLKPRGQDWAPSSLPAQRFAPDCEKGLGKGLPRGSGAPVGTPTAPSRECPPLPNTETSPRTGSAPQGVPRHQAVWGGVLAVTGGCRPWGGFPGPGAPARSGDAANWPSAAATKAGGEAPAGVAGGPGSTSRVGSGPVTPRGSRGPHVPR